MSEKGVMERTWENIQKKTFTGWVNSQLRKRALLAESIEKDLSNGLKLIALLEIISDETFPYKFEKKPNMRIQQVGNVAHCLSFIKQKGVNLAGIGAEEIVDGNLKMILGMIWTIILRFQIQDISMEDLSAKEGLLLWCQKKTQGYAGVNVKNFHLSFQDGLAFCALIHRHRPDLIDWDGLDKSNKALCLQTAFDVAEKHLDVPKLLDPADLLEVAKPDERSVMTYVSLYYHVFASSQKAEVAGRRVAKVIDFAESNEKLKNDYLNRAGRLVDWINNSTNAMNDRSFGESLDEVVKLIGELKTFRQNDKPPKFNDKVELEALHSGLQTKLALNNRPSFVSPSGLSPSEIDGLWSGLEKAEHERSIALRDQLRRIKKILDLLRRFNQLAGKLEAWADDRKAFLNSSDLGDSISAVLAKLKNLEAFNSEYEAQTQRVNKLKGLATELGNYNYHDMGTINSRASSIESTWDDLNASSNSRKEALEAHLAKLRQIEEMLVDFAKRALEFKVFLEGTDEALTDPILVESVEGINEVRSNFDKTVVEKESKTAEYNALGQLADSCKQAGVAEDTFSTVSYNTLTTIWNNINNLIETRRAEIEAEAAKQQSDEELRLVFASKAKEFNLWAKSQTQSIEALSGDVHSQLESLKGIASNVSAGTSSFKEVQNIQSQLENAQVTDNPHTDITIEFLKSQFDALNVVLKKKQEILEKEALAKSSSALSAEQLKEFKECFAHFDKDEDNLLNRLELGACLKSLGDEVTFEEGGKLDSILNSIDGDGDGKCTFDEFVGYMERSAVGSDTPDSIKQAFKTLAGDKNYVTENDLRSVLPPEKVQYIIARIKPYPGVDGGFDYNTFTDSLYA